jgi:hypothetical protein
LLARLARPPPLGAYLLLHERLRRLNAAAKMGQTRGPSTRASGLDGRRARAQADETHAIFALADIIAKGNALVHFGAPAGYTNSSCAAQAAAKLSVPSARFLG